MQQTTSNRKQLIGVRLSSPKDSAVLLHYQQVAIIDSTTC